MFKSLKCKKNFRYHNFFERVQRWTRNFSSLWDQKFSTEKCYTPPVFCKIFAEPEVFSKTVGFLYKSFRHCETNNFRRKSVTPNYAWIFSITPNFLKHWRDTYAFLALSDLKFSTEKHNSRNMHKFPRYHNFSESFRGCSRNFSAVRGHIFSTEKRDTTPLFIRKNFSKQEVFSKTKIFLHKDFRQCETEKLWRKYVIPSNKHKLFRLPQNFWNIEGMTTFFSALSDLTFSTEKCLNP